MCVDFEHVQMVIWNTLENDEDNDENDYAIAMLFIEYP